MARVRKRSWKNNFGDMNAAWICDWADEKGQRHRKHFGSKREADTFRIAIESQLHTGAYRSAALVTTVADLAEKYLEHCAERMHRGERMTTHNLAVYRGHIRNHILDPEIGIAPFKLKELSAARISEFRDRLRAKGVSVPTTRKVRGTLRAMLGFAIARDLLSSNPATSVRVIGTRSEQTKRITLPSKTDLAQLLSAADELVRLKILVAATTGVRAGEFHALRWRHIDFERKTLTVETRVDAYGQEDVTKTPAGMRSVPLGTDVLNELRAWRFRSAYSADDHLIFPNHVGAYECHANMVKRQFKPLFENLAGEGANPGVSFNWHALRHFAISCWIEAELSPKTVQTFAGHSSLHVTMDRYGHLFPADEHHEAMDNIAKTIFAS